MNWIQAARRWAPFFSATLIGALCVYYLLFLFPWDLTLPVLARAKLSNFILECSAIILAVWFLRAARFFVIARANGAEVPFISAYFYTAAALGLSAVTPIQAGEAFKMHLLRRVHELSIRSLGALFLSERLIDVSILFVLTAVFSPFVFGWSGLTQAAAATGALCGLLYVGAAVWRNTPAFLVKSLFAGACVLSDRLALLLTTLGCWALTALLWMSAMRAINVLIEWPQGVGMMGAVTFVNIASAIPGGLGVSEVSIALLLEKIGVEPGPAHASAISVRFISVLIVLLAIPHALWFTQKKES